MNPRIVYIGNFGRDWNTEVHVARDARAIGCDVIEWDEADTSARLINKGVAHVAQQAIDAGADLVLYTKTLGLPDEASHLWSHLEGLGIKTASYHLDLYVGLDREREIGVDPFWHVGTVFTADGDPHSAEVFAERGVNHRWLPAACVSDECIDVTPVDTHPDDVGRIVFVGSTRSYHQQWPWRLELLAFLRKRYGSMFVEFGPHSSGVLRGLDLNRLYQTPGRIVIGDTLALPGHTNYWSDRYYETLGRGGYLIAPYVWGIDEHFAPGGPPPGWIEPFVAFDPGDFDGLERIIDESLDSPEISRRIADQGMRVVRAGHTYQHRVRTLLDSCEIPL